MNPAIVEKDYWVTYALFNLSQHEIKQYAIFKGGTSLTKCFTDLKRFSEDIDIALLKGNLTRSGIKSKIKKIEEVMKGQLKETGENSIKHGDYRQTEFEFTSLFNLGLNELHPHIRFEIVSFTKPIPFEVKQVNSFIHEYLLSNNLDDIINEYVLNKFELNVLTMQRTVLEKLVSLIRMSYEETLEELSRKTRHLYDLHLTYPILKDFFNNKSEFIIIADLVKESEEMSRFKERYPYDSKWHSSPLVNSIESEKIKNAYKNNFGTEFVYGTLPPYVDVKETIEAIFSHLSEYNV